MKKTYAIKTENITTIASDTFAGWKETFEFLKSQGVKMEAKSFSDYGGDTIASDQIFYYHVNGGCPVSCPAWKF